MAKTDSGDGLVLKDIPETVLIRCTDRWDADRHDHRRARRSAAAPGTPGYDSAQHRRPCRDRRRPHDRPDADGQRRGRADRPPRSRRRRRGAARRAAAKLDPFAAGAYVNTHGDEGAAGVRRAYSQGKRTQLTALKDAYDP